MTAMTGLPEGVSAELAEKIVLVRRAIHEHPELSNREHDTQALVWRELTAAGIDDVKEVADTGLIATIRGSKGKGRILGLRGDMDALPIQEDTDLPFASKNAGVMHACGHDSHTAMVLGATIALHRARANFAGQLRCIFQPAEETEPLGGRQVVESGVLDGVEGILSLHVDPAIDAGKIGVRAGPLLAGGQEITIRVKGTASHAARPHLGADAVLAACGIVQALQTIASRRIDPLEPVVVTIGKVVAGTAKNIIADSATIEGTLRVLGEEVRTEVVRLIRELAEGTARNHGCTAELETSGGEPVLMNDPGLTDLIRRTGHDLLGADNVVEIARPSMGSEDFAFYVRAAPVSMFRLGIRNEDLGYTHPLHHPAFAVDETALPIGAAIIVESARRFLDGKD